MVRSLFLCENLSLICLALILVDIHVEGFSTIGSGAYVRILPISLTGAKSLDHGSLEVDKDDKVVCQVDNFDGISINRRAAIRNIIVISTAISSADPFPAVAYPGEVIANTKVELDSLKDLPPISENCIRLYLCRHGQTENNRLRIVQGARVDPPLNINGKSQATNLGLALGRADPKPKIFFSSSLLRAKMTADLAANVNDPDPAEIDFSSVSSKKRIISRQLAALAEIDFGPVADGKPISTVEGEMAKTYTKWATGDVDFRPEGGGDSGREVLIRVCEALETLVNEAKAADVPCVAAVTHSAYLRVLVGIVLDEPLIQSSIRKIRNGSITVVDVPKDLRSRLIGSKPKLLGGWISRTPRDFTLSVPLCKMIRINETRHVPLDKI